MKKYDPTNTNEKDETTTLAVPPNIRMRKISYKGSPLTLTLKYERMNKEGMWDEYEMATRMEPHPDFVLSLNKMGDHLQDMCEQYGESGEPAMCDAKSVTVTWSGDQEVMGCVISGGRTLYDSYQPLNINTPHKVAEPFGDYEDPKQLLSVDCIEDLEKLMDEAWSFIEGKRKQLDMFGKEGTNG